MATFKEALTTSLANFSKSIAKTYLKTANIVDNLLSTDSTLPLSAKQGNVLQSEIDTLNSNFNRWNSATSFTKVIDNGDVYLFVGVRSYEYLPAIYVVTNIANGIYFWKVQDENSLFSLNSNGTTLSVTVNASYVLSRMLKL